MAAMGPVLYLGNIARVQESDGIQNSDVSLCSAGDGPEVRYGNAPYGVEWSASPVEPDSTIRPPCTLRQALHDNETYKAQLMDLKDKLAATELDAASQEARRSKLTVELSRARDRIRSLEESATLYEERIIHMEQSNAEGVASQNNQRSRLERRCALLKDEAQERQQDLADSRGDLQELRLRHELYVSQATAQIASFESKIRFMEEDNSSLQAENTVLKERCRTLDDSLAEMTASCEIAQTDLLNVKWQLLEEISRLEAENCDREADIQALHEEKGCLPSRAREVSHQATQVDIAELADVRAPNTEPDPDSLRAYNTSGLVIYLFPSISYRTVFEMRILGGLVGLTPPVIHAFSVWPLIVQKLVAALRLLNTRIRSVRLPRLYNPFLASVSVLAVYNAFQENLVDIYASGPVFFIHTIILWLYHSHVGVAFSGGRIWWETGCQ
ncbi:hypothetical protein C2E23DRAFT_879969 [Lenzites betulinus]|nr:hypothetical protein C2E23DRAFT_879969 [Lenzites betulinus]